MEIQPEVFGGLEKRIDRLSHRRRSHEGTQHYWIYA